MPININTQAGPDLYQQKMVTNVYIDYVDSLGITVQGIRIKDLDFTSYNGLPPAPKDGVSQVKVFNANYWDPRATITISQTQPYPFHIIGVGMELKTNENFGAA